MADQGFAVPGSSYKELIKILGDHVKSGHT